MEEFIANVAKQLGIDQAIAKSATSQVLKFIQDQLGDESSSLLSKLAGADALVSGATNSGGGDAGGGGGMLGSLSKMAFSAIGGSAGEGLELAGKLKIAGLGVDQAAPFLTSFTGFVKQHAGEAVIDQVAEKIPALKELLG